MYNLVYLLQNLREISIENQNKSKRIPAKSTCPQQSQNTDTSTKHTPNDPDNVIIFLHKFSIIKIIYGLYFNQIVSLINITCSCIFYKIIKCFIVLTGNIVLRICASS